MGYSQHQRAQITAPASVHGQRACSENRSLSPVAIAQAASIAELAPAATQRTMCCSAN